MKKYNSLCSKLDALIKRRAAPRGAVAPTTLDAQNLFTLDAQNLFTLDVDDPIWNDRGLGDLDDEVPLWVGDDKVREGMRGILLKDRCKEEIFYLQWELDSLVHWFSSEWNLVDTALNGTGKSLS